MATHPDNLELCANCNSMIPSTNIIPHSAVCFRRNIRCKLCSAIIDSLYPSLHMDGHSFIRCSCGVDVEKRLLSNHQSNSCIMRLVACTFCELQLKFNEMTDHESDCGNRTEECEKCHKRVLIRLLRTSHTCCFKCPNCSLIFSSDSDPRYIVHRTTHYHTDNDCMDEATDLLFQDYD